MEDSFLVVNYIIACLLFPTSASQEVIVNVNVPRYHNGRNLHHLHQSTAPKFNRGADITVSYTAVSRQHRHFDSATNDHFGPKRAATHESASRGCFHLTSPDRSF